mmetsp:Transcript_58318/g.106660  ORF Transcript_58318/g.106660 Transcript_58318/m.106660 type:complete len:153 (-) Transcript_58318:68-526(-)
MGFIAADFEVHWFVQVYFIINCLWTGGMGALCTYNPKLSPITENGTMVRNKVTESGMEEEVFEDPNVRAGWNVRGGSMFLVFLLALVYGKKECYMVALAAALWREGYDCIELTLCRKEGWKFVFRGFWSAVGPIPPLALFEVLNIVCFALVL